MLHLLPTQVEDSIQHAVLVEMEMSSWERGLDERQLVLTITLS